MINYRNVVILAPPFYSHFSPLLNLGMAFKRSGATVTIACDTAFESAIREKGLEFYPLTLSRNANTGVADQTKQAESESERLEEFFAATYRGPVETLRLQAEHRQQDMLADPERIWQEIGNLAENRQPDLFVVDQLSYSATLALYCHQLPFMTFCPGHPTYIPKAGQFFGVPYSWPQEFDISHESVAELSQLALRIENHFTEIFNEFMTYHAPGMPHVKNAFQLHSQRAIIFNYPEFETVRDNKPESERLYIGYNFEPESLSQEWKIRLDALKNTAPIIFISFGTFLSARADVLSKTISAITKAYPNASCFVAGGASTDELRILQNDRIIIEEFLPQKALLPYIDLVIHHGGCNSFTESLYFGKTMLIMPFSSDQFAIAADAQHNRLAACLDPNHFEETELLAKISDLLGNTPYRKALGSWSRHVRKRGPGYAVQRLQSLIKK